MENKKYTSKDAMEDLSITILKKALMKQGIHLERFPFKDKGLDVLIKVLPSSSVKIEDKKYEFLQVEDAFNRMMYGQVKSSQNDDYFLTGNKAKFSFEIQHLRMWKEAGQPVIVFLVDLRIEDKETIYWKNIDCKFKIKEEQGSQVVYLDKIIDKGCWKQFDNILIDWNKIRKKGLKIESDIRMNQLMEEFPYFDEISLLPEFTAFKEKREKWEEERNRLVFQEFNPVKWEGQMQSPTPQIGYRTLVPKTEYAKFSDPSIPVIYSMISDDIVRGIFLTEEKKLLEDLIIYSKNCNDLQEFLEFEEVENTFIPCRRNIPRNSLSSDKTNVLSSIPSKENGLCSVSLEALLTLIAKYPSRLSIIFLSLYVNSSGSPKCSTIHFPCSLS